MTNFEIVKGTKDSTPDQQIKINKILNIIKKNFENYGFRPFDTPIIEYFDILTLKYDEDAEISQEIYKLKDRGKRNLGLRYDLTTPLSRFIASQKQLKKPFRRYQIGKVFRDGPIKKGRLREFIQCDGDVIGINGIEIEAELLIMFYNTFKDLKINPIIELNNNKILRGALLQQNINEKDLSQIILSIDKLKKIGIDGVLNEIKQKNFNINKIKQAIEILNSKTFDEIKKIAKNNLLIEGINELEELINLIKKFNVNFKINFSMSRGLDIYTGNIWEAYEITDIIKSSIGSGGRYNKIIGEYSGSNEEIPATGISFGLVPILACLENNKEYQEKQGLTDILIVPLNQKLIPQSFEIANSIRQDINNKQQNIEIFYEYKLKKAFSYVEYLGCDKIIIVGEKDIQNNEYTIKTLSTKQQQKITFNYKN